MEFDFLQPVSNGIVDFVKELSSQHLGNKVVFHTNDAFPDIEKIDIAIIGVFENRGKRNVNEQINLDYIRKEFYSLFPGNWIKSIADLGDILPGNAIDDTYFAVQNIVALLLKKKIK